MEKINELYKPNQSDKLFYSDNKTLVFYNTYNKSLNFINRKTGQKIQKSIICKDEKDAYIKTHEITETPIIL